MYDTIGCLEPRSLDIFEEFKDFKEFCDPKKKLSFKDLLKHYNFKIFKEFKDFTIFAQT